jgi:hypothetical protein
MLTSHMACIGAAIIVLAQGFETFSQQMVLFVQRPQVYKGNETYNPAPPPPMSQKWDTFVRRGGGTSR